MNTEQTYSWIFLAVALASQNEPADSKGISTIADGINHAVPTQKDLQTSISWLSEKGLISKQGKKYQLTLQGKNQYQEASANTSTLLKIWENLEEKIKSYA